uniref:NADH dehydrogenase subunit 3 n=1 Tax=Leucoptera coffeella TaxID=1178041 RepID=UPI002E779A0F|nr:NADH dehydrogenase subunit 3 [Leucoptera coffeella]WPR14290.1 NADH dehydrogenase subunit 3 [Leucoptera coffeella]
MFFMNFMTLFFFIISLIMITLSYVLSKKSNNDREKCSPFECGFNPKSSARVPFSLHFFLITVIFLIFDIEIALILPMIPLFNLVNMYMWSKITIFFLIVLLLGVYHEWNQGMLNWTN